MTENEAIEALKLEGGLEITGRPIRVAQFFEGIDVAIKALEEVQRWHISEINPEIKNVFANISTQICHNCDHKDEYIVELEAEMEQYQTLEKRLTEMFGDQLSLETVVDEMERVLKEPGNPHPVNAKILTYEDAKAWEEYKEIGTPEELQEMKKDFAEALSDWRQYRKVGTLEECRAAVEKQTAKRPDYEGDGYADGHLVYDTWICPCCGKHYEVDYDEYDFCPDCGQKLDWRDEE